MSAKASFLADVGFVDALALVMFPQTSLSVVELAQASWELHGLLDFRGEVLAATPADHGLAVPEDGGEWMLPEGCAEVLLRLRLLNASKPPADGEENADVAGVGFAEVAYSDNISFLLPLLARLDEGEVTAGLAGPSFQSRSNSPPPDDV